MNVHHAVIGLVWLESPVTGTAAGHHLRGTLTRLRSLGVLRPSIRIAASEHPNRIVRLLTSIWRSLKMTATVDVIIARWHPLILPLSLFAWALRTPLVFLIQGSLTDYLTAHPFMRAIPLAERLATASLRLASGLVVPHPGWREEVSRASGRPTARVQVLPNGPPVASLKVPSQLTGAPLPEKYVMFAGSLAAWQGVQTMMEALNDANWPSDVSLVVVGDGAEADRVLNADSNLLHYLGRLPTRDVHSLMQGAIASLSPKLLTAATAGGLSPFKLLEAGQNARPIIASAITGQVEYVQQYNCGLLFPPGAPSEMASAVARLARDPQLADNLGANGRRAAEDFAWEAKADVLGKVLTHALGETGRLSKRRRGRSSW